MKPLAMFGTLAIILGSAAYSASTLANIGPDVSSADAKMPAAALAVSPTSTKKVVNLAAGPTIYTQAQLLKMASNKYADGNLPLGDSAYITTAAKKGYIYLCRAGGDPQGGGAGTDGPWITGTTWNYLQKVRVSGAISWPNASFKNTVSGTTRTLTTSALPIDHATGIYPIAASDGAYAYDRNPNGISPQSIKQAVPANPKYSKTPFCMGGEVGIMLSGVPLFNGFDAQNRDAAAHEVQDSCDGHPQNKGEYHYHSMSACWKDIGVTTVLGYAYDGFPITGPLVAKNKYLTTDNLDECHGLTSEIIVDGKKVTTYHYVMTQDFPYSASCFRGVSSFKGGGGGQAQQGQGQVPQGQAGGGPQNGQQGGPPAEAIAACSGKSTGATCSIATASGQLSGHCDIPPGASLACIPR